MGMRPCMHMLMSVHGVSLGLQACGCRNAAEGLPVPGPGAGINASDATVYEDVQKARA